MFEPANAIPYALLSGPQVVGTFDQVVPPLVLCQIPPPLRRLLSAVAITFWPLDDTYFTSLMPKTGRPSTCVQFANPSVLRKRPPVGLAAKPEVAFAGLTSRATIRPPQGTRTGTSPIPTIA